MSHRRATLIQDLQEYIAYLTPYLEPILENYAHRGIDLDAALQWIIREEIELIYLLCDPQHLHNHPTYSRIHNELDRSLPGSLSLSMVTSEYIKVPMIYNEYEIQVRVQERDLYIFYYSSPPPFVQYVPQL